MNSISSTNYTPSFQAYYKSSFSKSLENTLLSGENYEKIIKDFAQVLKNKKNTDCKIGEGGFGEVFRIDDYFVFKTYHDQAPNIETFKPQNNEKFKNLKLFWGNVIAKIGNIEIKRNVTKNKNNFVGMANVRRDPTEEYNHSLKEFLKLPQKAFDNLAAEFKTLNNIQEPNLFYAFDTNNPNNFIKVGKSIRIVDNINRVSSPKPNDLFSFMKVFIQNGGDKQLKKEILKKCILASEKNMLPMDNAYKYLYHFMDTLFGDAGVKVSFEDFYVDMTKLRSNCSSNKRRMQLVKDYVNNL